MDYLSGVWITSKAEKRLQQLRHLTSLICANIGGVGGMSTFSFVARLTGPLVAGDKSYAPCSTGEPFLEPCAALPYSPRTPSPSLATPATSPVVVVVVVVVVVTVVVVAVVVAAVEVVAVVVVTVVVVVVVFIAVAVVSADVFAGVDAVVAVTFVAIVVVMMVW